MRAIQFYSKDLLNALLSRTVYLSLHIFARPILILFIFVSRIILFPQDIISPQSLSLLHSCYLKTRLERGLTFLVLKSKYNPKYKQGSNNWQTITTRTFWDKNCFFFYTLKLCLAWPSIYQDHKIVRIQINKHVLKEKKYFA